MSGLPELIGETSPDYKKIIVEGVIGNVDSIGLQMLVYSSLRDVSKALESEPVATQRSRFIRTAECELILSPITMKSVYEWLGEKLENYEAIFGKIPSNKDISDRAESYRKSKNLDRASE